MLKLKGVHTECGKLTSILSQPFQCLFWMIFFYFWRNNVFNMTCDQLTSVRKSLTLPGNKSFCMVMQQSNSQRHQCDHYLKSLLPRVCHRNSCRRSHINYSEHFSLHMKMSSTWISQFINITKNMWCEAAKSELGQYCHMAFWLVGFEMVWNPLA